MLFFSEDGVIGFKPIFLEHCIISGRESRELIGIRPKFQCDLTLDLEYLSWKLAFQPLNIISTATYLAVGSLSTTEHIPGLVP